MEVNGKKRILKIFARLQNGEGINSRKRNLQIRRRQSFLFDWQNVYAYDTG